MCVCACFNNDVTCSSLLRPVLHRRHSARPQDNYEGTDLLSYWMTEDGIGGIERQRQSDPEPSDLAASYLVELSKQVQSASLLELEPKQGMHQRSTVILLRGSVHRFTYVKQQQQQRSDHTDNGGTSGWECIEECFECVRLLNDPLNSLLCSVDPFDWGYMDVNVSAYQRASAEPRFAI